MHTEPAIDLVCREYFAHTECADTAGPTIKSHFSDEAWQRRASQKFVHWSSCGFMLVKTILIRVGIGGDW
ncbi:hypothetical protein ARMGADRAFT_45498 [Armillaria gallica]|uniref:Uncharacterized protein n=1 Tax=Armillaria gallica TaxID=47427 RepID=A0A2H3ED49_ARMGA|nr:hypothetical protein ARMGADRAFT_45498 [Armillaria gallica]